jgi:hypothetical protein
MNTISRLDDFHNQSMELADEALIARRAGDTARAEQLTRQALDFEASAANIIAATDIEPTRSVLHRSAATLAFELGEYRTAERLIAAALTGEPPPEIALELRELLLRVWEKSEWVPAAGD